jgi:hypothetical protein
MPEITNDDDNSGFIGLIAVFACLKESTPKYDYHCAGDSQSQRQKLPARNTRLNPLTSRETSHMSAPSNAPTAKGGTFKSRTRMAAT